MIDGIHIIGYRSFDSSGAVLRNFSKANIFIGKNNCGKSNILRFIKLLSVLISPKGSADNTLSKVFDYCYEDKAKKIILGYQIKKGSYTKDTYQIIADSLGKVLEMRSVEFPSDFWFYYDIDDKLKPTHESIGQFAEVLIDTFKNRPELLSNITESIYGRRSTVMRSNARMISETLHHKVKMGFSVHVMDAFRQISDREGNILSGAGLIKQLRKTKNPELSNPSQYQKSKDRFAKIECFLQHILGEDDVSIEIPAEKDELLVTISERVLPLESLGTGIHELIIMASAVTMIEDAIFCIEEPEIHLHPELQKKFLRYIIDNTSNQYFISTHSNALFDQPDVNIYRCSLNDNAHTTCQLVSTASEKHDILIDLGYRPSDLLQANYVIWVEGPSDRIYINHWIHTKCPNFVEGLHYAIMFYGGRLLSHLAYDEPLVEEFIQLSCLNRNACIVMDSDKEKIHGRLNETKRRIKSDFESKECLVWVTKGRTIENYVPEQMFNDAVATVHPKTKRQFRWKQFEDMTHLRKDKIIDKVAVARKITEHVADFSMLGLDKMANMIVEQIRKHNSNEYL